MRNIRRAYLLIAVTIATMTARGGGWVFAKYPEKPIKVIVACQRGGSTDLSFRLFCKHAEKYLGVSLVVENTPGAGGEVGFTALAMAEADGYTLGVITTPSVVTIPIERKVKFTLDNFEPLIMVRDDPCVWAVKADGLESITRAPDSPFKRLKDIVNEARKYRRPALTVGISGIGGDDHLAILEFERLAGIKLVHVPFNRNVPTTEDLLVCQACIGRHTALWGSNLANAVFLRETGVLRMLGVMARERHRFAPDVPTFEEQGYPVYMESTQGLAAPAGIHKEKLNFLIDVFSKTMANPDFIADAKKMKLPLGREKGQEYLARLRNLGKMCQEIWEEHPWR